MKVSNRIYFQRCFARCPGQSRVVKRFALRSLGPTQQLIFLPRRHRALEAEELDVA